MQYIDFKVQHQTITRTDNYEVVGNSENYLYARFEFCAEWDDIIQTAVFSANNGKHISVLIENGECLVPWEMLRVPEFWVGVFGGDRQTTDTARVGVKPGVRFNARPGVEPTPTAYELLMNELRDGINQVEEHTETVENAAVQVLEKAEEAAESAEIAENAKDAVLDALNNAPGIVGTVVVNDLTTGGATAALSAEMGKVLAKRPNPNILHNWYFTKCVNQRGKTEYTEKGYTFDCWQKKEAGTVIVASGYVTVGSGVTLMDKLEAETIEAIKGKEMTFSVLTDTELVSGTATYNGTSGATFREGAITLSISGSGNPYIETTEEVNILAVKLELGGEQTLAHEDGDKWVLNEIPDFGEELAKCQRYYIKMPCAYSSGFVSSSGKRYLMPIFLPVPMRYKPNVSMTKYTARKPDGGYSPHTGSGGATPTSLDVYTSKYTPCGVIDIMDNLTESAGDTNNMMLNYMIYDLELSAEL